jgi:hypothetical protein
MYFFTVFRIWIWIRIPRDPHYFGFLFLDPDPGAAEKIIKITVIYNFSKMRWYRNYLGVSKPIT